VIAVPAIAERAAGGDAACQATLAEHHERLARALALVLTLVDPDVVVLGGGLAALPSLYDEVPARWARWVYGGTALTRLARNVHGDASGVRGAAWLWDEGQAARGRRLTSG
jgi:fructokinase